MYTSTTKLMFDKNLEEFEKRLQEDKEFLEYIRDRYIYNKDFYCADLREEFGLRQRDICYLRKKYDFYKPKELVGELISNSLNEKYKDQEAINLMISRMKATKLELYGDENYNNIEQFKITRRSKTPEEELEITNKRRTTCMEIYGVDNINKIAGVQDKKKKTWQEKYGVDHPMKSKDIQDKSKATCLEKYGAEYVLQVEEVKEKGKATKLEIYGDENYNNPLKHSTTCIERYGKDFLTSDSRPNLHFKELLDSYSVDYVREFPIYNKIYDFKLDNYLVEINPWSTHNSTLGIFRKDGLPIDYHFNKSKLAWENGYKCIHVWDWDDYEEVVKNILSGKYENNSDLDKTIYLGDLSVIKPIKYIWNKKLKKLVDEFTSDCVLIYGVGQI